MIQRNLEKKQLLLAVHLKNNCLIKVKKRASKVFITKILNFLTFPISVSLRLEFLIQLTVYIVYFIIRSIWIFRKQ